MATNYASLPVGLFTKTLKDIFMVEAAKVTDYIGKLYNVTNTDLIQNIYQSFPNLGPANTWSGEETITFDTITALYETTISQIFYRKGIEFTWKMKKYEQYGLMKDMTSDLAKTMARTKQVYGVSFFNGQLAGTGAVWNATDNQRLFDNAHLINGTAATYDNLLALPLNVTNLQTAITTLFKSPDDNGNVMGIRPKRLWVPPDLQVTGEEVLNSGTGMKSGTSDRTKNTFDQYGIELAVCEHLTDTNGWILQGDYNKAQCEISQDLTQEQDYDFDTKSTMHDAIFALNVGALDWRGWVGSRGS